MEHRPVLLKEVLYYLDIKPGQNFIDCTFGFGGHGLAILEKAGPKGKLLGIELNLETIKQIQKRENLILEENSFAHLKEIVEKYNFQPVHGILLDLGMSSWQLKQSKKGFSFQKDEPLDMRFGNSKLIAAEIINCWLEKDLIKIFTEYGQERFAGKIAEKICLIRQKKEIRSTSQLVEIIRQATPNFYHNKKIHFATRIFQALRIAVNDELNNLSKALAQALEILKPQGRIIVISFHSLEDKIAKNFFKNQAQNNKLKILAKKPIKPGFEEIRANPSSRSAKLRAAQKI